MVSRVLLCLLFGCLLFADFPAVPHAGTEADPQVLYNSSTLSLNWDGYSEQIVWVEVEFLDPGDITMLTFDVAQDFPVGQPAKIPLRPHVDALANGTYKIRIRVADVDGNQSVWSDVLWARKRWISIPQPTGCSVSFR